jgi:uncharacterized membrane protein YphA (DoxX/SURF4 family)
MHRFPEDRDRDVSNWAFAVRRLGERRQRTLAGTVRHEPRLLRRHVMSSTHSTAPRRAHTGKLLWVAQVLLALVFLFAGGMKLAMASAALAKASPLPVGFLRFIGTAEVLGALGLVLPGLFRIHRELTPLAAAGLVIIMIGAVVVTLATGGGAGAVVPAVVGILAATVVRGRRSWRSARVAWRAGSPSSLYG